MLRHRPLPARAALLLAGILLIAANLRAPITGVAPVLAMIQAGLDLGTAQAGLLTTLPLLAFALLSPVAPLLARRIGLEWALFAALALIAGLGVLIFAVLSLVSHLALRHWHESALKRES